MTRIHGRAGVAYLALNYGDAASPVAFLSAWDITFTSNRIDVTPIIGTQHIYVAGEPSVSGSFSGFFDTATVQTYSAAIDGLPRNMNLYPAGAGGGAFFTGMVLPDYSIGAGTAAAVALSVTWTAVGPVTKGGIYPATYAATY